MWDSYKKSFNAYLRLEKSLAENSVAAYLQDLEKFTAYLQDQGNALSPADISLGHLQQFVHQVAALGMTPTSQARIISGIKAFYKFCLMEDIVKEDPAELLQSPKTQRALPDVLDFSEIENIISQIDHSAPQGERNRALLETMYSCGLRVSEATSLRLSHLFLNDGFIRVTGKGSKERLIPIGREAVRRLNLYLQHSRSIITVKPGNEDIVFLNRRGRQMTRQMIFLMIRDLAAQAGIKKNVSPHTFRHSFATHLIEGGANLRAIQEMLGHESITTTEIYTHLDREFLRKTLEQFHPAFMPT